MSFQVLGHMKTVCVLILGWLLFDSELTLKNILGMSMAVVGMVVYSWAVEAEKKANSQVRNNVSEENAQLLKQNSDLQSEVKDVELGKSRG